MIAKNADNKDIEMVIGEVSEELDPEKVQEISERILNPSKEFPDLESISEIRQVWATTNANRKLRSTERIKEKISTLHIYVKDLAIQKGISPDRIEEALSALEHSTTLNEALNRYRHQFFPELDHELKQLQDCEECQKHFTV